MRGFTLEDFRATLDQYSKENDTAIYLELHDELIARYADLTAKLETMTLERNILYDTAVEDGLSAGTPTIDQAQELARMQSELAAMTKEQGLDQGALRAACKLQSDLHQQLSQAQATIGLLQVEQLRRQADCDEHCQDWTHAQLDANKFKAERDQLQATVTNREHECEVLRGQRELAEAKCNRLQATVTAQQGEIARLGKCIQAQGAQLHEYYSAMKARASCSSDVTHWMPVSALPGEVPHILFGAREIVLPEGESPTAITTYKDHVIVACTSGKIFSVWGASGLRDAFLVKERVFAVSQDEEPS